MQGQLNTGFVFIRSNQKTRIFMDALVSTFPLMLWSGDDQVSLPDTGGFGLSLFSDLRN